MENKDYGRIDEKLISLPKNFKLLSNLLESKFRETQNDAQELKSEFIYIIHNWNDFKNLPFFGLKLKYAIWLIPLPFLVWLIVFLELLYYLIFC